MIAVALGEPSGQGWLQVGELALAFVLSALIGLEREIRQKSAPRPRSISPSGTRAR